MTDDKKIDDLVALLDNFMENGGGHMNVQADDNIVEEVTVETFNSISCSSGNMACGVPTLHQGIDDTIDSIKK